MQNFMLDHVQQSVFGQCQWFLRKTGKTDHFLVFFDDSTLETRLHEWVLILLVSFFEISQDDMFLELFQRRWSEVRSIFFLFFNQASLRGHSRFCFYKIEFWFSAVGDQRFVFTVIGSRRCNYAVPMKLKTLFTIGIARYTHRWHILVVVCSTHASIFDFETFSLFAMWMGHNVP